MTHGYWARRMSALGLGLAIGSAAATPALAQGVSSGSGSGTGTGQSAGGLGSTGTGRESSSGLGTTGTGSESLPGRFGAPGSGRAPNFGDLTKPADRQGASPSTIANAGDYASGSKQLFIDARAVENRGERALALIRVAQTAIFSKQLDDAHQALFEAAPDALNETDPLIREQRLTAVIDTLLRLAEERMGDIFANGPEDDPLDAAFAKRAGASTSAKPDQADPKLPGAANPTSPSPSDPKPDQIPPTETANSVPASALPASDRKARLDAALPEWGLGAELAMKMVNPTAQVEALFRIAESEAYSSQRLINQPLGLATGRPDPASLAPDLRSYTDLLLSNSARHARMIKRPVWRNAAFYSVISNAAASSQFTRGFEIARAIEQPEARTDALIRLAEGQALNGHPNDATAAYLEAAKSAALIPQDDPRETLIGVLIDSLISYGRFDDARACVKLYAIPARQLVAYSAIAQSQGRRGLAEAARKWIATDTPPAFRPTLYRKVSDGLLSSIEQNRSRGLTENKGPGINPSARP